MPDGRKPEPGGWGRFVLEVDDIEGLVHTLKERDVSFRNQIIAGPGVDYALTMQRQRIGVFRHDHMREQTGSRTAALNRKRRQWRLHDRRTGPAGELRPHLLNHLEE